MHDGPHDGTHDDCPPCRWRTVSVAPSAMPSRKNSAPPASANPAWERGIVTEKRPDGSEMPYLDARGNPIRVKAFGEHRKLIEQRVKELKQP